MIIINLIRDTLILHFNIYYRRSEKASRLILGIGITICFSTRSAKNFFHIVVKNFHIIVKNFHAVVNMFHTFLPR